MNDPTVEELTVGAETRKGKHKRGFYTHPAPGFVEHKATAAKAEKRADAPETYDAGFKSALARYGVLTDGPDAVKNLATVLKRRNFGNVVTRRA